MLYIFNNDFVRLGLITAYISLTWEEYYQEVGRITLIASDTPENIEMLRQGNIIYQHGKDTAMIIRYVQYNSITGEITVNGFSTMDLMNQRILAKTEYIYNAEQGMYNMVKNNLRGLPYVDINDSQGFTEVFDTQVSGRMMEGMQKIAVETELGFKMLFDYRNKRHLFTVYKGVSRIAGQREPTPFIFSEEFKNLNNTTITDDMSVFANVAYVFGAGEGEDRKLVIVGDAEGLDRFELYVDARDLQPEEEESVDSARYEQTLRSRGIAKLNEHIAVKTFVADVDSSDFRDKYNLGDEISCKSKKYGVQINTRIMAYTEVTEKNLTTLSLTLGNPEISVIKEIKLWNS